MNRSLSTVSAAAGTLSGLLAATSALANPLPTPPLIFSTPVEIVAPSRGINEARLIVGDASNPNIAGATFWLPSKTAVKIDLSSTAEQINDRGQIVGIVFPVSPGKAAVWQIEGYKPVLADIKAAAQICQGRPIFHN